MKECCYTVCKPVCETHCHKACHQVCKQYLRAALPECCHTVCKPVCETCYKDVCCTVCKPVLRDVLQGVCRPATRPSGDLLQGLRQDGLQPGCTTCKTVQQEVRRVLHRAVLRARQDQAPAGSARCDDCCFDPCTCQTCTKHQKGQLVNAASSAPTRCAPARSGRTAPSASRFPARPMSRSASREGALHRLQEGAVHGRQEGALHRHARWCTETIVKKVPTRSPARRPQVSRSRSRTRSTRWCCGAYVDCQRLRPTTATAPGRTFK